MINTHALYVPVTIAAWSPFLSELTLIELAMFEWLTANY